ncbi:hypothetical protein GE061_007214 [Apolygus lucorum]|uniref:Uncharacterized protein n=1 Tax=Apolygus lucorum TaxID=248454 RepID=A0A8S9WSK7_APOLU|nr:hypothetical protein GE061_007214 [Apolygus lucorum]
MTESFFRVFFTPPILAKKYTGMKSWWILLLVGGCLGQQRTEQAFTELFPEQIQQQKVQFRQSELQTQLQILQQQAQVASGNRAAELAQQQTAILAEIMRLQQEMQKLQGDIQLRLSGSRPNFRPIEVPQQQAPTAPPQQFPPEPPRKLLLTNKLL